MVMNVSMVTSNSTVNRCRKPYVVSDILLSFVYDETHCIYRFPLLLTDLPMSICGISTRKNVVGYSEFANIVICG